MDVIKDEMRNLIDKTIQKVYHIRNFNWNSVINFKLQKNTQKYINEILYEGISILCRKIFK